MEGTSPSRHLNISLSQSKVEAYISISYSKDNNGDNPPKYNISELKNELLKAGIVYGIIEENLAYCTKEDKIEDMLVAKGDLPLDGEDDILEIKFEVDKDIKKLFEDSKGRVDFKSIGAVNSVLKGNVIAEIKHGDEGQPGKDIKGKIINQKPGKKLKIKASHGCELKDENTIIASIDGKPCMKKNTFYVYDIHEVTQDVDLQTGNIVFLGDITIYGGVKEGMKVHSGNSITIFKNVERSEILAKGEIIVKGNAIASKIIGGGEDVEKLNEIENLTSLSKEMKALLDAVEEIKKFDFLGYNTPDGQIIKLLLESKFKSIPKICISYVAQIIKSKEKEDLVVDKILDFIKSKVIGLAPLNIRHYSEFYDIVDTLDTRLKYLKDNLAIPVNVKVAYCQDSIIESTGDVIVSGSGSYISSIKAQNNIYFTEENSVVRGGTIKAGNEIRCKIVGSHGGVVTRVLTEEKGHIWINVAYENTVLGLGNREFILEYPCKDIHAFMNDNYELTIDRLKL